MTRTDAPLCGSVDAAKHVGHSDGAPGPITADHTAAGRLILVAEHDRPAISARAPSDDLTDASRSGSPAEVRR